MLSVISTCIIDFFYRGNHIPAAELSWKTATSAPDNSAAIPPKKHCPNASTES